MRSRCLSLSAVLFLHVTASAQADVGDVLVLSNARVYTVDGRRSWAEAVAIDRNGIIAAVGTAVGVLQSFPDADVVDLDGRMVLPGFHDVHLHAIEAGISATYCEMPQFGDCAATWDGGRHADPATRRQGSSCTFIPPAIAAQAWHSMR
ncbi:MAG: amidohydrolase family protein [Geminicoccaceae bacterium]